MNRALFNAMLRRVEGIAGQALQALGPLDLATLLRIEDIAGLFGLDVEYGGLSGAAARLTKPQGGRKVLRVRSEDEGTPRGRFGIAHEIGHDRVHGNASDAWCSAADMRVWHPKRVREAEANAFAGAFLLPRALVEPLCRAADVSFEVPRRLRDEFQVSSTAAAIRFVRLSEQPCAVVRAVDGHVDFAIRNDHFWPWIFDRGDTLHADSLAFDCHRHGRVRSDPEEVPAAAWIDDDRLADLELVEHTIYKPRYRETLTLLWARGWPLEEELDANSDDT